MLSNIEFKHIFKQQITIFEDNLSINLKNLQP